MQFRNHMNNVKEQRQVKQIKFLTSYS